MPGENYARVLANARTNGEAHEYRHLGGWHDARRNTVIDLYIRGKANILQAIAAGARPIDHARAMDAQANDTKRKAFLADLIAVGVDLHKIEVVRKQMLAKLGYKAVSDVDILNKGKTDAVTLAQAQAYHDRAMQAAQAPKASYAVKRGDSLVQVRPKSRPSTLVEIEVAEAMAMHELREKNKATIKRLKANLAKMDRVSVLTDAVTAELLARNANKGKITLK